MNHQETYQERNKGLNHAELYAVQHYENRKMIIIRSGLDALNKTIPAKLWVNIPKSIRNLPDYIIMGDKGNYFLECKGGKTHVHFKISELKSYSYWNDIMPVIMFVWSSTYNTIYRVEYPKLMDLISEQNYEIGEYPNNQEKYHIIPMADLTLKGIMDAQPGYYLNDWNQAVKLKQQ